MGSNWHIRVRIVHGTCDNLRYSCSILPGGQSCKWRNGVVEDDNCCDCIWLGCIRPSKTLLQICAHQCSMCPTTFNSTSLQSYNMWLPSPWVRHCWIFLSALLRSVTVSIGFWVWVLDSAAYGANSHIPYVSTQRERWHFSSQICAVPEETGQLLPFIGSTNYNKNIFNFFLSRFYISTTTYCSFVFPIPNFLNKILNLYFFLSLLFTVEYPFKKYQDWWSNNFSFPVIFCCKLDCILVINMVQSRGILYSVSFSLFIC